MSSAPWASDDSWTMSQRESRYNRYSRTHDLKRALDFCLDKQKHARKRITTRASVEFVLLEQCCTAKGELCKRAIYTLQRDNMALTVRWRSFAWVAYATYTRSTYTYAGMGIGASVDQAVESACAECESARRDHDRYFDTNRIDSAQRVDTSRAVYDAGKATRSSASVKRNGSPSDPDARYTGRVQAQRDSPRDRALLAQYDAIINAR